MSRAGQSDADRVKATGNVDQPASDVRPESRSDLRTNMLVMAIIVSESGSGPCKVRNLSASGALVEGAVLPRTGASFELRRADLNIQGQVVWSGPGRVGLRFNSVVTVSEWLPRAPASGQQRVDELVQQLKAGPCSSDPVAVPTTLPSMPVSGTDLLRAKGALEALGNDLADDPEVLRRHSSKLQALDVAGQLLGKLAVGRA